MLHLVRIAGVEVDGTKQTYHALTKIKGVSWMFANAVVKALNLDPTKPIGAWDEETLEKIEDCIKNPWKYGIPSWLYNRRRDPRTGKDMHLVTADLELVKKQDIDFMKKIRCYRGIRHALGLKVRGQRTRSTGRKGRTVGVSRKKAKK